MYIVRARYWIETSRSQRTAEPIPTQAPQTHVYWIAPVQFMLQHSTVSIITGNIAIFLLSTDDALQLYFERLKGVGICMVNLVDDIHEYMRGLFFIMWVFSAAKQKVCNSADYTHCACGIINNCVCVCAQVHYTVVGADLSVRSDVAGAAPVRQRQPRGRPHVWRRGHTESQAVSVRSWWVDWPAWSGRIFAADISVSVTFRVATGCGVWRICSVFVVVVFIDFQYIIASHCLIFPVIY